MAPGRAGWMGTTGRALGRGLPEGVVAYLAVFLGVYVLAQVRSLSAASDPFDPLALFPVVLRVYAVHVGVVPLVPGELTTVLVLLYLVPVAALTGVGWRLAGRTTDPRVGVVRGAGVTAGYFVVVVGSYLLFVPVVPALAPDDTLVRVGLVAGLLYPAVFGGLGGYLRARRG